MPANLKGIEFFVPKVTDKPLLESVSRFVAAQSVSNLHFEFLVGGEHLEIEPASFESHTLMQRIRADDSFAFECVRIVCSSGEVTVIRDDARPLFYKVRVSHAQNLFRIVNRQAN